MGIPNLHFHKKYCQSSRGPLKVKLSLDQATKKKARRINRAAKAAKIAPRPLKMLRPSVRCPTQRYNSKLRLGRGFSLDEVKASGITAAYARTIGIAVDHRRVNRSKESLDVNVERLKEYLTKVIVFPKRRLNAPKKGDASAVETAAATQYTGHIMPLARVVKSIPMETITDEMKNNKAFTTMRVARKESKVAGYRCSVVNRKKKD